MAPSRHSDKLRIPSSDMQASFVGHDLKTLRRSTLAKPHRFAVELLPDGQVLPVAGLTTQVTTSAICDAPAPDPSPVMTTLEKQPRIYHHPSFARHDTTPHPENPARIHAVDAELRRRGFWNDHSVFRWNPATDEQILRVHTPGLLISLEEITSLGGGAVDPDTLLLSDSLQTARLAAGAGVHAIDAMQTGEIRNAFVLGRPPGHHATRSQAMGFCLLNTIAITAAHAFAAGFGRIAIIDWDVHHGNGTQDIFYDRSDVLFCSIHQYGNIFPGSGSAQERGRGEGTGYTLNVPLQAGDAGRAIVSAMIREVLPAIQDFRPDLILLSAGYDAHFEDPIGGLRATDADFRELSRITCNLADELTGGRLIAVLEGGYNPQTLARCVADTIAIFEASSIEE